MFDLINRLDRFLGLFAPSEPKPGTQHLCDYGQYATDDIGIFLNPSTVSPHGEIVQSSSGCEKPVVSQRYPIDSSRS